MKETKKVEEQCEAIFDGMRCKQDKNRHRKCGSYLKHNFEGCSWTDAGAARVMQEREAAAKAAEQK